MNRLSSIVIIALSSAVFAAFTAPETSIKAPMKKVIVYPDRAQINHEARVEIPGGTTDLVIGGLSPYIDARSIQIRGTGNFTINSVNHANNYLQDLEEVPEVKSIRSQIEALQLKVEDEKAAVSVLKEKEAFLVANRAILVKETSYTLEQMRGVMDLFTTSMEQVTNSILRKNRLIKDYERQIAALQNQVSDRTNKLRLPSGEITISVSSEKPVGGKLEISYLVSNAGWFPSYDIRVEDITRPVTIFYKANLFQNTGVEWKEVLLSFSNATPWVAGDIPEISPWFIDFYTPAPVMRHTGNAPAASKSQSLLVTESADMAKAEDVKEAEAMPVMVEKRVGETTVTFDVTVPYTIAPDGKVQTIEIQRTSSPAEYRYVTVPKLSPHAYLTGNITDWAGQSLIGGEATLYFENTFVGKSYLNVNQLKDTLTISLGTDNSILVRREKRQDFTSKRTIGSNITETFSFLITLRNNKQNQIKMMVYDQIPVSSNSSIEVNAVELSGGRLNSQTGEVIWTIDLKPQEVRQIIMTYSVRYPKDKTIILD